MEEHRLQQMGIYDAELFERIYKQMIPLKRKLASNIQHNKLGVEYEDLLSMFDVKLLFAFQKYAGKMDENLLQGHIIKALQFYRNRILREIYKEKNSAPKVEINDLTEYDFNLLEPELEESKSYQLEIATKWVYSHLSQDARLVFMVELNPPAYIINKLQEQGRKMINHLPAYLVCEYLGWPQNQTQINRISELRREIRHTVKMARVYFKKGLVDSELAG
jgi:hypothetical protein